MRRASDAVVSGAVVPVLVEMLERRQLLHAGFSASVNFQPAGAPIPSGYLADYGYTYGSRSGLIYGWSADNSNEARDRNNPSAPDQRYDTLTHMQRGAQPFWEIAVPNGMYNVRVVAGDPSYNDSVYKIAVEGVLTVNGTPTTSSRFVEGNSTVTVNDGRLTVTTASGAVNNKISFIEINEIHHHDERPEVSLAAVRNTTEGSSTSGRFSVTRTGATTSSLTVTYSIGGSASNGTDYQALSGTVTIAAGSSSAVIDVHALTDEHVEGDETVTLTLLPGDYDIGASSASITIADATVPPDSTSTWSVRVNFQPGNAPVPDFYRVDSGAVFGTRANGLVYGWNVDNTADARDRNNSSAPDQRYDTMNHMRVAGATWEIAVPNGTYTVRVVAGDPSYNDSVYKIAVEGVLTVDGTPTSSNRFVEGTQTVTILDGRITITSASGAVNNKIAFVEINSGSAPIPVVGITAPAGTASESGDVGRFRFTRTGNLAASLLVNYTIGGNATNGSDYQSLSGSVIIPAGSSFADVLVTPIDDSAVESNETVVLTLASSSSYSLAAAQRATVTILDNDSSSTPSTNINWAQRATGYARAEAFGGVVGGKLYVFGGYGDGQWKPVARVDVYDPTTNTWTRLRDLPERLTHSATAVDGQYIYIAGGYPGTATGQSFSTNKVWRYDTVSDTYTAMKNLPWARGGGAMAVLNGHLYHISGSDSDRRDRPDVWSLDLNNPSANWVNRAPLPEARNHFGAVTLNGFIYAVGGQTGQDSGASFKSNVWRYNPSNNTWTSVASLLSPPRSHAAASTFVHNGRIVIIAGETSSSTGGLTILRNVESYDPATNSWSVLTSIPQARTSGVGGSFGDQIIFTGGYNGGFKGETWIGTFG